MKRDTGDPTQNTMAGTRCTASDRFQNGSMQAKHSAGLQDSGTTAIARSLGDQIRSATLGTDADGYDHHYYRPADTVVVYDAGGVDHVEYLDGRPLSEWREYVGVERGWQSMGQLAGALLDADRRRKGGT